MTPTIKNSIGLAGIAALLAIGGIAAVVGAPYFERVPLDKTTQCPMHKPVAAHTAIIVDETDPFGDTQVRALRAMLNGEAGRLALFDELSVLLLTSKPYELPTIFSMCAPKNPANEGTLDGNKVLAQRRWDKAFGNDLDAAIRRLREVRPSSSSPIIEAVKAITWRPDFGAALPRRRLVLFSDFLQNSSGLSQYKASYDFENWRRTEHGKQNLVDLRGVEVVIYYLERPETLRIQTDAHRRFWQQYFIAAGATVTFADGWTPERMTRLGNPESLQTRPMAGLRSQR